MPDGPKVSPNNGFELGVALALSADSRAQNDGGVSSIAVRQNPDLLTRPKQLRP
jgi:hypothetical protein